MRPSGRGSGRRMVPYSLRFKLTEPYRRNAARGLGLGPPHGPNTALDLSSLSLMRPGGTRAEGGGEGAQVGSGGRAHVEGGGGAGVRGKDMHALYFKF